MAADAGSFLYRREWTKFHRTLVIALARSVKIPKKTYFTMKSCWQRDKAFHQSRLWIQPPELNLVLDSGPDTMLSRRELKATDFSFNLQIPNPITSTQ